tara:strand:+ start:209 stop:409 length:201 start_codon:yes stop_codon:yes gene_type:complete
METPQQAQEQNDIQLMESIGREIVETLNLKKVKSKRGGEYFQTQYGPKSLIGIGRSAYAIVNRLKS